MLGAIAGDIIGSIYEANNIKTTEFPLFSEYGSFTDDTVLTAAIADVLLEGGGSQERRQVYVDKFHDYFSLYPNAGFGETFFQWARLGSRVPYGSWGNGSAMRVSPIGWAFETLEEVLREARLSAAVTHDHPEGIRGAQAVAAAVFLSRRGTDKAGMKTYLEQAFQYDLSETLAAIQECLN